MPYPLDKCFKENDKADETEVSILPIYKAFAALFFPKNVLDYYDVIEFVVDDSGENGPSAHSVLHVYMDERDNRDRGQKAVTVANSLTREMVISDYPIGGKSAVIHIRRRRWLGKDGTMFLVNLAERYKAEPPSACHLADLDLFLNAADEGREAE